MNTQDFFGLGMLLSQTYEKTAAEKAGDPLVVDAYLAGFKEAFGVEKNSLSKIASRELGRAIMGDFIPKMLLNK